MPGNNDILAIGFDFDLTETHFHCGYDELPQGIENLWKKEQELLGQPDSPIKRAELAQIYDEVRTCFIRQPNELERLIKKYSQYPNIFFAKLTFNHREWLLEFFLRALLGENWQQYIPKERIIFRPSPLSQFEIKQPYIEKFLTQIQDKHPDKKINFILIDDTKKHCTEAIAMGHASILVNPKLLSNNPDFNQANHLAILTEQIDAFVDVNDLTNRNLLSHPVEQDGADNSNPRVLFLNFNKIITPSFFGEGNPRYNDYRNIYNAYSLSAEEFIEQHLPENYLELRQLFIDCNEKGIKIAIGTFHENRPFVEYTLKMLLGSAELYKKIFGQGENIHCKEPDFPRPPNKHCFMMKVQKETALEHAVALSSVSLYAVDFNAANITPSCVYPGIHNITPEPEHDFITSLRLSLELSRPTTIMTDTTEPFTIVKPAPHEPKSPPHFSLRAASACVPFPTNEGDSPTRQLDKSLSPRTPSPQLFGLPGYSLSYSKNSPEELPGMLSSSQSSIKVSH